MSHRTISPPAQGDQTAFNLRRWNEVLATAARRAIDGRMETDADGQILMQPAASFSHGSQQFSIASILQQRLPHGRVAVECPISTTDGVKVADVAWISHSRLAIIGETACLTMAPEICVEVLSPDNTHAEMRRKKRLSFAAGAAEVWMCDRSGTIEFFLDPEAEAAASSLICPDFPCVVRL